MSMTGTARSALEYFDKDGIVWVCKVADCGFVAKNDVQRDKHEHQDWQEWHLPPRQADSLREKVDQVPPLITKEDLARARPNYKLKSKKGKRLQERLK